MGKIGKKILIIDDERIILESLRIFIKNSGYDVHLATDGISGFEMVEKEKPDLILIDILLPGLNGVALCEKLRISELSQHIPIILMTGVYKDVNLRMYVHKGLANDFIEKPFNENELLIKIDRLLGRGQDKITTSPGVAKSSAPSQKPGSRAHKSVEKDLNDLIVWARSKSKK
jgi:two-component system alkaline phosphatase synthesis response regulator PhoP